MFVLRSNDTLICRSVSDYTGVIIGFSASLGGDIYIYILAEIWNLYYFVLDCSSMDIGYVYVKGCSCLLSYMYS